MSLQESIVNFCISAIIENEAEMYGMSARSNELLATLTGANAIELIANATINYMNNTYVSLIKRNDSYIIEKFDSMCKTANHSVLCLLNIIWLVLKCMHLSLSRFFLNTKTYDIYMSGVKDQLSIIRDPFINKLNQLSMCSHQCSHVDITTYDPSKPLFRLRR